MPVFKKSNAKNILAGLPFPLLLYLLSGIAPVTIALHLRHTLLSEKGGGYEMVAQFLALPGVESLSYFDRLALFREDLLLLFVLWPLTCISVLHCLSVRLRGIVAASLSVTFGIILYVELKCYWEVGTFLPATILWTGVTEVGRDLLPDYLRASSVAKVAALLSSGIFLAWGVAQVDRQKNLAAAYQRGRRLLLPVAISLLLLTALSWSVPLADTPFGFSSTQLAIRKFLSRSNTNFPHSVTHQERSSQELVSAYAELAEAPLGQISNLSGTAADYDVIFVVLETAPFDCFEPLDKADFPNVTKLLPSSFIGRHHYSTYPYTVRAIFSIYTSWYPSNHFHDFIREFDSKKQKFRAPGVVQQLRGRGYRTAIFVPENVDNWEHDRSRYEALGFSEIFFPNLQDRGPSDPAFERRQRLEHQDRFMLDKLKNEIRRTTASKERYFFAFHPQFGHGPWPGVTGQMSRQETFAHGRKVFAVQDAWLGEIFAVLEQQQRFDKTIIVITGDHGIRTRTEHPNFSGGTIVDETFHVPLLIYAPGVLTSAKEIDALTSHIDISPSVLDLLGISSGRDLEFGTYMWNPQIEKRATFFFARNYLGTDGFQQQGFSHMVKYLINRTFLSRFEGKLRFQPTDLLPETSQDAVMTELKLEQMSELQTELARTMAIE